MKEFVLSSYIQALLLVPLTSSTFLSPPLYMSPLISTVIKIISRIGPSNTERYVSYFLLALLSRF